MTGEAQPISGTEVTEWMAFAEVRKELGEARMRQIERREHRLNALPGRRTK